MAEIPFLAAASFGCSAFMQLQSSLGLKISKEAPKTKTPAVPAANSDDNRSTTSSSGGGPAAYETQKAVDEYLLFHFGGAEDMMPYEFGPVSALSFTARLGELGKRFKPEAPHLRAVDVGCAVGGASFELAKWCNEVIGIDYSHAFVRVAEQMRTDGELPFSMQEEGDIYVPRLARRPNVDISRVSFQQGDACHLEESLGQFDVVLAANLLCRLPEPVLFITRLKSLLKVGGILVLVSPHSWLPGWTPRSQWLGGFVDEAGPHRTADGVAGLLRSDFTLLHQEDVPFLIREHVRKFQYGVSMATVWQRNAD